MEIVGVVNVNPPSAITFILNVVNVVKSPTGKVIITLSHVAQGSFVMLVLGSASSYFIIGQIEFDDVNFATYERASSLVRLSVSKLIDYYR